MKNIFILPTDNQYKGSISLTPDGRLSTNVLIGIPQNIYISSDEEIKEGEKCITFGSDKCKGQLDAFQSNVMYSRKPHKIILTTDRDLIKDGVQGIDDEFLEWFVKNSSCESVEVIPLRKSSGWYDEKKVWHWDFLAYKIIIPQEEVTIINGGGDDIAFPSSTTITFKHKHEQKQHLIDLMKLDEEPKTKCYCGHTITCDCEPLQETIEEVEENIDREEWINFFKNNSKEEILEYLINYKFPL
jgi:hypothetical protein